MIPDFQTLVLPLLKFIGDIQNTYEIKKIDSDYFEED